MAFTWTTISGGKNRGAARAWSLLEAGKTFVEETFAPQADHVAPHAERGSDFVIGPACGGQEHHPGPQDCEIRQRIFPGATLQDCSFLPRESELEKACSRHSNPNLPVEERSRGAEMPQEYTLPYLIE